MLVSVACADTGRFVERFRWFLNPSTRAIYIRDMRPRFKTNIVSGSSEIINHRQVIERRVTSGICPYYCPDHRSAASTNERKGKEKVSQPRCPRICIYRHAECGEVMLAAMLQTSCISCITNPLRGGFYCPPPSVISITNIAQPPLCISTRVLTQSTPLNCCNKFVHVGA